MVPRPRHSHRIAIETLKRELEAHAAATAAASSGSGSSGIVTATSPSSKSSSGTSSKHTSAKSSTSTSASSYLSADDAWKGSSDYLLAEEQHQQLNQVGDSIPGFRTSAVFLSSLRTNLRLLSSPPPSPMSTPPSMRASTTSIAEPSPLAEDPLSAPPPTDPLAALPELHTYPATTPAERTAALKLVADSVAQMRQTASSILIFHPLNLALYLGVLALVARYLYRSADDIGIAFTTCAGLTMAALIGVRWITQGYLWAAEEVPSLGLLDGPADVLVTQFGDEVIGAVVVGWSKVGEGAGGGSVGGGGSGAGSVGAVKKSGKKRWRAEVRAWAVRLKYRGKGVGEALLEDAVRLAREKGADGIEFAVDHANSKRVLWPYYNTPFDKKEQLARTKLHALWSANGRGGSISSGGRRK